MSPKIGLIVPPKGGGVPPECTALYGDAAEFLVADAALKSLDLEGYAEAERRLPALARSLADQGAEAVVLMGTSLSFYRGRAHAEEIARDLAAATGLPATTMSAAIAGALHALGAKTVALGTAYIGEVNDALVGFLTAHDIAVGNIAAMDIREVGAIKGITEDQIVELGLQAWENAPGSDALFLSCGGLQSLGATTRIEAEIGVPVVSSAVAGAWAAAAIGGLDPRRQGHGRFLERCGEFPEALIARGEAASA